MARKPRGARQAVGISETQGDAATPAEATFKVTSARAAVKPGRTREPGSAPGESDRTESMIEARLGLGRQAPPAGWLQAYIDEASPSRITGWLWDPQQPQR